MPLSILRPFLKITTIVSIAISSISFATGQETALKKKQSLVTQGTVANYHVLANNDKQGLFQIWDLESPKVLVQGGFTDNNRSGNWVFFDYKGRIIIRHNYTLNKLITMMWKI